MNDQLTLNLGLRYEYATPWVEKDNILSNFDPRRGRWCWRADGSLEDRSTLKPDRNNFGPRLGLAYTLTPQTVVRGGYGMSYVHFHRAGGANVLPINGPQVINAVVVQTNPPSPDFRTTQQGYPAGLTDPSRFDPLAANITYMPRTTTRAEVQSWFVVGAARVLDGALRRPRLRRQPRRRHAALRQLQPGAPNNAAGTIPLQSRRPIPEFADITYSFNGGKSRYHAFQGKFDWRVGARLVDSQLADAVEDQGQRRRLAREPERQLPGAAGLLQPRRRLRPVGAITSPTTARPALCSICRSAATAAS